jgi:hypothetical protein
LKAYEAFKKIFILKKDEYEMPANVTNEKNDVNNANASSNATQTAAD